MKTLKGYLAGVVTVIVLTLAINSYASTTNTIQVAFNSIKIAVNGIIQGDLGEGYVLDNGKEVPYSILYEGTTYLPLRKVAELLDKEIGWDGDTRTASVNNRYVESPFELISGNYIAGEDFKAGKYDIVAVSGAGNVSSDNYLEGNINAIMGISDNDMYEKEYKNITLSAGTTLRVSGVKIKLIEK